MTYAFIWYQYCPKRHVHIHLALPSIRQDLSSEGTSQPVARLLPPDWNPQPSDCKDKTLATAKSCYILSRMIPSWLQLLDEKCG